MRRIEQETVINFNAEEDTASIYTADPVMIRRLDRLTETHPQHYQLINRTDISKTYACNKALVNLRRPQRINELHREWSRKQMQEMNRRRYAAKKEKEK